MIEIRELTKIYDGEAVVDNLNMRIPKGSVFGFLGPNGAGKTTTVKMIIGLISADKGVALVDGKSLETVSARESIGYMPENPYFYSYLTGFEFLRFCGELFRNAQARNGIHCEDILKEVGIFDAKDAMIREYSKGMKQRLGFAQAIVNDPEYIFLDEPLDGLDPIGRREVKQIILHLKKRGKTIFFNSHILSDVQEMCDQIGIINRGKLIYAGSVAGFCGFKSLEERFMEVVKREKEI